MTWVTRPCNNGLDCYLASPEVWKCSAFDRPQGFQDKANFTGKMASRRDGFWGIKIPGFFCPAGTYGMYVKGATKNFFKANRWVAKTLWMNKEHSWLFSISNYEYPMTSILDLLPFDPKINRTHPWLTGRLTPAMFQVTWSARHREGSMVEWVQKCMKNWP